jgi:hypothetical protein
MADTPTPGPVEDAPTVEITAPSADTAADRPAPTYVRSPLATKISRRSRAPALKSCNPMRSVVKVKGKGRTEVRCMPLCWLLHL